MEAENVLASPVSLSGLTEDQKSAILHREGPLLILAGAGSGKTRVITQRVINLISEGVRPEEILAITFTNKAAHEMKERINRYVAAEKIMICTFHAFCSKMLRRHAVEIGYTDKFIIYDETDCVALIKTIVHELGLETDKKAGKIADEVFVLKMKKQDNPLYEPNDPTGIIVAVFSEYQIRLKKSDAMDFEDLLTNTLLLMEKSTETLSAYQSFIKYILVDEYQDTNETQAKIIFHLGAKHRNICVCGDPNQSIYSFRGARIQNILDFQKEYPESKIAKLEQNFRSTKNIIQAANELVAHNSLRFASFESYSTSKQGDLLRLYVCASEESEAYALCKVVEKLKGEGFQFNEMAILYRTLRQSQIIERAFLQEGIPHKIFGKTNFYRRKEIKDVLAYLRLSINRKDDLSLSRVLNTPTRGIGKASLSRMKKYAHEKKQDLFWALENIEQIPVSNKAKAGVRSFLGILSQMEKRANNAYNTIAFCLQITNFKDYLSKEEKTADHSREAHLDELLTLSMKYHEQYPDQGDVVHFLENAELASDDENLKEEDSVDRVTMMTIHASKGLEFPVVFLVGMERGILPHNFSLDSQEGVEEERRLCYVGFTRAKEILILTRSEERSFFPSVGPSFSSPFLEEFSMELIKQFRIFVPFGTFLKRVEAKEEYKLPDKFAVGDVIRIAGLGGGRVKEKKKGKEYDVAVIEFFDGSVREIKFIEK